jgi:hypothetical protein
MQVSYSIQMDNVTMTVHETGPYMGDIMLPLPIGEDGYTNMEDALTDVKSLVPPSANWTGKFNTVNYRYPLTLCTTEHVYFFTDSKSKDFEVR